MAIFIQSVLGPLLWSLYNASRIFSTFGHSLVNLLWSKSIFFSTTRHQHVYCCIQDDSLIIPYIPEGVEPINLNGSSATIGRVRPGVVLKSPRESWWGPEQLSDVRRRRVDAAQALLPR